MTQDKKYIKGLVEVFMSSCNPQSKQFYGSLMLERGGKLILREPKNLDIIIKTSSDFTEIKDN